MSSGMEKRGFYKKIRGRKHIGHQIKSKDSQTQRKPLSFYKHESFPNCYSPHEQVY